MSERLGGFIIANLSAGEPPDFESVVNPPRRTNWTTVCEDYGTTKMKVAARQYYPVHANWKLVLENFHECYHCGPAHRSLVTAHPFWDGTMPSEQRDRLTSEARAVLRRRSSANAGRPRVAWAADSAATS